MKKKSYKIGILVDQLIVGGVQKIAVEDAKALEKLGHKAEVLVLMRKGYNPKYKNFFSGVKVRFLSDSYPFFLKHSIKFPIFSFFSTLHILSPFLAPFAIKEKEFDIIVSHGTTTCFTAQALKHRRQIPYLAAIHDPMEYILKKVYRKTPLKFIFPVLTPILKKLEANLIANCEQVLLLSEMHQKFISKTYKIHPEILPSATNIPKTVLLKKEDYILATTRWEKGKNPKILIEIAKKIPQLKLKIAGIWTNNEDYENFQGEIGKEKLEKQIDILCFVSEKKLQKLYQKARFFVHPIVEAFGMGGLEAAANGCPVIIPQGSGITNYLKNGRDGIFVKKAIPLEFIQAAQKLWADPKICTKMGMSARKQVADLSWENHAKKLLEVIDENLPSYEKILVALETGHASISYLSGGDKLLEKMSSHFPKDLKIKVILPQIGTAHWQQANLKNVELLSLPKTPFDNNQGPVWVFMAYIARIWHSYWKLKEIKNIDFVYSSTNVLPDIAPVFFYKLTHKEKVWIARIHHLINSPFKRPGSKLVNLVSFSMQYVSNFMIRKKADKIIALHSQLSENLISLKFPPQKISVLGAGVDFEKINKVRNQKKIFDGVFLGRIHPAKGVYDLISIWQKVIEFRPDSKAIIIGGGSKETEKKLVSQIKKEGLSKNLAYLGYLPEKELYTTLKRAKIFLFCDYEAGWGLAIAESMAAGLPTVGYNLKIFGDVFKKGYKTIPLGNKEKFAEKIIELLENKKSYQKLQREALSEARKLSWEQTSRKMVKLLEKG